MKQWLACAALSMLLGCAPEPREIVISGPTMGTTYTVRAPAPPDSVAAHALRAAVDDVLARIDRQCSGYRDDSEIAQFNASTRTDWIAVSRELADIVRIAEIVGEQSGGAFDVTVAPLVRAWGFGPEPVLDKTPDESRLSEIRETTGREQLHVRLEAAALRKDHPELTIDLNGIAPGYAVDRLADALSAMGVDDFLIELGGEVRARGRNARGEGWRVAIEHPSDDARIPYAIVQVRDMAVATSGDYRQSIERDGRRISHTVDPRSGRPIEHEGASVVVIGPRAAENDAWATALNVLGPDEGFALASSLELAALFIERRGATLTHRATKQFAPYVISFHNDNEG